MMAFFYYAEASFYEIEKFISAASLKREFFRITNGWYSTMRARSATTKHRAMQSLEFELLLLLYGAVKARGFLNCCVAAAAAAAAVDKVLFRAHADTVGESSRVSASYSNDFEEFKGKISVFFALFYGRLE